MQEQVEDIAVMERAAPAPVAHSAEQPGTPAQHEAAVLVAIDDGHSETKVAYLENGTSGKIVTVSFPSRAVRGIAEVDAHGGVGANAYRTYDDPGAVGDHGRGEVIMVMPRGRGAEEAGDNRTQHYPVSDRNRVLVHHALHQVANALGGLGSVAIATSLPYSDFHQPVTGAHNLPLINAKKANLSKAVRVIDRRSFQEVDAGYEIIDQSVYSEGVAAFFDSMLDYDPAGGLLIDEAFAGRFRHVPNFVVVDVGGKTTDIVYGSWTGQVEDQPMININRSESLNAGALDAADDLGSLIKQKFSVRMVTDAERALLDRAYFLMGISHPINDLVDAAIKPLAAKIRDAVYHAAGDGSDLAYVIVVGGGSVLLKEQMDSLFPSGLLLFPPEPRFANARGMLKLMLADALADD